MPKNTLTLSDTLKYYKRIDIERELVRLAENREIAIKFGDRGFGKRPDILRYENDVLEAARNGATSFHASEELWDNPLMLVPSLKSSELNELRIGWDLIIDIDCHFFDYSKIAAKLVVEVLRKHGIKAISCKFSGNKGFHIGVPFESFPKKVQGVLTKNMFPEAPRRIAYYIAHLISNKLGDEIINLENKNFNNIVTKVGKPADEIIRYERNKFGDKIPKLNTKAFLEIDTLLISSRHLFRMPYSLHEKSGLASVPINPEKIMEFEKEEAKPNNVEVSKFVFLDRKKAIPGEASFLLMQAFDFSPKNIEKNQFKEQNQGFESFETQISQEFFAPCIKNILRGLEDGRKRALFILLNYLRSLNWDYDKIEKLVLEWNKHNKEPLRENYIIGQLNYHKKSNKKILPPNCSNSIYYKDIGVCTPDNLCSKIKNPVNYSIIKLKKIREVKNKRKQKKTKTGKKLKRGSAVQSKNNNGEYR